MEDDSRKDILFQMKFFGAYIAFLSACAVVTWLVERACR